MPTHPEQRTERSRQKAERRERLLQTAAGLFAERGFGAVSIEDLGAAAGVTGPAIYRHFASKQDLLASLLIGISRQLLDGSRRVRAAADSDAETLERLVAFHTDFALTAPDLIRIQERDLAHLNPGDAHSVRQLQRAYVEAWVSVITRIDPKLLVSEARTRAHAAFGLLNSTPHSASPDPEATRAVLEQMAMAALLAGRSAPR